MNVYINGYSAITNHRIISSEKGKIEFEVGESPLSIGRKKVYSKLHTGFGKLNPPDKLAFSAASLILDNISDLDTENTAISMGTSTGSFSTDMRYMESVTEGFPSPAYFQATLPSSPVAEVAILFKLKGPDRTFVSCNGAGIEAINGALRMLMLKKATSVLVLFINGTDEKDFSSTFLSECKIDNPFGFGLLLSTQKVSDSFNFRLKVTSKVNKNIQDDDEVAYFLKLINCLYSTGAFSETCSINRTTTEIQIKKEI